MKIRKRQRHKNRTQAERKKRETERGIQRAGSR